MGTIRVRALKSVYENGIRREPGDAWDMEVSLAGPHVDAGQVEVVPAAGADKQAVPARDKQSRPGQTKTAGQG